MTAPFVLSVLDQSPISEGSTGAEALRNTLDLARLADALGYHRYWVAEHHGGADARRPEPRGPDRPDRARPPTRIRVGSGGVMLPHYSPLKVAETFSMLSRPLPRPHRPRHRPRARHRPADDVRAAARPPPGRARRLPRSSSPSCSAYLEDRLPARPPVRAARRPARAAASAPELWLLGLVAAERDLGRRARPALLLRRLHQPDRRGDRGALPRAASSPSGAPGGRRASPSASRRSAPRPTRRRSASPSARAWRSRCCAAGRPIAVPPVEKALRFLAEGRAPRRRPPGAAPSSARRRPCARGPRGGRRRSTAPTR